MSSQIKTSFLATVMFIFSSISYADDIDILTAETLVDANILFVMDLSGSMNELIDGSTATRLEELSGAFQNIVADNDFSKVNFGLSVFSGNAQNSKGASLAHGITYPVSPIIGEPAQDILNKTGFTHPSNSYMPGAGTNDTRQYLSLLSSDLNIWSADGNTPIVDALFEAARYFRGEDVLWGRYTADDIRSAHPSTYEGTLTNVTNVTAAATTIYQTQTRTDLTDGINCTTNTGNTCSTTSATARCGLTTNCSPQTITVSRWCDSSISTIAACETANPSWTNFSTYSSTSCTTKFEKTTCSDTTRVRAQEDIEITSCDAADTYTCDFPVDVPETTETVVTGNAVYKSPIVEECAANGIILLTDGAPTVNQSADQVATMIGGAYATGCQNGSEFGRCGPELANFMASEDHADGSRGMPDLNGTQAVKTYAVGLALDLTDPDQAAAKAYLDDISLNGNGAPAIIAANKAELTQAFKDAINSVVGKARSFSSPSYSVDTSTLLTNGPYVYIPVFDRSSTIWPGNLKKYKVVNGVLTDADNKPALDASNALLDDARDLWSTVVSTDSIKSGGAANKIDPSTRNTLTDNGTNLVSLSNTVPNADFDLSTSAADTAYKDELVAFIKGTNPNNNTVRNHMGDIIHSKPVQLTFASGRKTIFVGSNEGYLHAINDYASETDARNGTEAFAYMPNELLKNIKNQYSGVALPKHIYGVDGEITVWLDESANANKLEVGNNVLDVANGEKAYVFFGLRRGGSTYTALEVTDPDSPSLVWSKSFDTAGSWSQPLVTNLIWKPNNTEKPVVIIGGGFNDDASGNEIAGGNGVYVIDAMNGSTVWSSATAFSQSNVTNFTGSALPNAVPSKIRMIDLDRNNSVDRLYFGDTGGNIWRVDLNAANFDANTANDNDMNKATLHRIAALGGTGVNMRQFFEEPDVATFKRRGKLVSSIAIGSGNRPNPMSTAVEDKFFVIYDSEVTSLPTDPLITLTSGNLKTVPVSKTDRLDPNYKGWQKSLTAATGEKILSSALTFQGKVLFTSFASLSSVPDPCNPSNVNENKLYVLDIFEGSEDLVTTHPGGEILDTPSIHYNGGEPCQIGNCTRTPKIRFGKTIIDFPPPTDSNGNPILDPSGNVVPGGSTPPERVYWIDSDK